MSKWFAYVVLLRSPCSSRLLDIKRRVAYNRKCHSDKTFIVELQGASSKACGGGSLFVNQSGINLVFLIILTIFIRTLDLKT